MYKQFYMLLGLRTVQATVLHAEPVINSRSRTFSRGIITVPEISDHNGHRLCFNLHMIRHIQ